MAVVCFRDRDALRLALASGAVPRALASAPVLYGLDAGGRVWVDVLTPVARETAAALQKVGGRVQGQAEMELRLLAESWAQILVPLPTPLPVPHRVVLEIANARKLPALAAGLRRLGRSAPRWTVLPDERVVASVDAAPLYTLLGEKAYGEQSERVWVELGHRHPLATPVVPARGAATLIDRHGVWQTIIAPPTDKAAVRFPLPVARPTSGPPPAVSPIEVRLRSAADSTRSEAEFWLLDGNADDQLAGWLREVDDGTVRSLRMARLHCGKSCLVLLAAGKGGLPVLVLDALPLRTYLKLPNLLLPVGRKLRPPLRRDVARARFAGSADRITWLRDEGDILASASCPAAAFRPLAELVHYDTPSTVTLNAVTPAAPFTIEPFDIRERPAVRIRPAAPPAAKHESSEPGVWRSFFTWVRGAWRVARASHDATPPAERRVAPPNANDDRPRPRADRGVSVELERQMLVADSPAAGAWHQLAATYTTEGRQHDAAAAHLEVVFLTGNVTDARGWLRVEMAAARLMPNRDELRQCLAGEPTTAAVRVAAAYVVAHPPDSAAAPRLADFIRRGEAGLPVKALWLAAATLARATGDVLALARARDGLFQRLAESGLRPDVDLPPFVRAAGGSRTSAVLKWLPRGRELAQRWLGGGPAEQVSDAELERVGLARERVYTPAYADLMFAWGLARLGGREAAQALAAAANGRLPVESPVHGWLAEAWTARVRQALAERTRPTALPGGLRNRLAALALEERVAIDRFRQASRVLEDTELVRPYAAAGGSDPLTALAEVDDAGELGSRIDELLRRTRPTAAARLRVIGAALQLAPRVGQSLAARLIEQLLGELDPLTGEAVQCEAVASGLRAAAATRLRESAARLSRLVIACPNSPARGLALGAAVQSLRRLGLIQELEAIAAGSDARTPSETEAGTGTIRLALAEALFVIGGDGRAITLLEPVRSDVLASAGRDSAGLDRLAAYVSVLAAAAPRLALGRFEELFRRLAVPADPFSSNAYFALAPLRVIEAVVRAAADDGSSLSPRARWWADGEELRLRQRVQSDLTAMEAGP